MSPKSSTLLRRRDEELQVDRTLKSKNKSLHIRYILHIFANEDFVIFHSLAFKIPRGGLEQELQFSQLLLMYNGFLEPVTFGLSKTQEESWGISLNSVHKCSILTPKYFEEIIRSFDRAYCEIVPNLKLVAKKLGLEFSGKIRDLPDLSETSEIFLSETPPSQDDS
ncbi:MAG: hypothetical protein N2385_10945 [Chloroflexus sp.]|nr:hypothetical protein [Chloroflexus sp.]